jgi:hypothetical protein
MPGRPWWIVTVGVFCAVARSDHVITLNAIDPQMQTQFSMPNASRDLVYVCPMDPDVRSHDPGSCRRCGMTQVAGFPDPLEFHLDLGVPR